MKLIKPGLATILGNKTKMFPRAGEFEVVSASFDPGTNVIEVTTNKTVTACTIAGWSVTINATPDAGLAVQSFAGNVITLTTTGALLDTDDIVITYDSGTGDTFSNELPLLDYTGPVVMPSAACVIIFGTDTVIFGADEVCFGT